jgi:hypothetical protein
MSRRVKMSLTGAAIIFMAVGWYLAAPAVGQRWVDVMSAVNFPRFVVQGEYVIVSDTASIKCVVFTDTLKSTTCYSCNDRLACVGVK